MVKRVFTLLFLLILSFNLVSCEDEAPMLRHCELRLPLYEGFYEVKNENYDALFSNGKYMIALTRIPFESAMKYDNIPETLTDVEFGELYLEKCEREAEVYKKGVAYTEYSDMSGESELYYLEAFYRSPYAYFALLFASHASLSEEARTEFLDLAGKVYFINDYSPS